MEESREVNEVSDKIEQFWRDATPDDVARVMKGETVEIRVRDGDDEDWVEGEFLGGFHRGSCEEFEWKDRDGVPWIHCQVYDPPEWFVNKPDPGEGWRLLEKFPPEEKEAGDEWFSYKTNGWVYAGELKIQRAEVWYRRRIDTNNPEIPDSSDHLAVLDSLRPPGWRALLLDEPRLASDAYWSQGCNEWLLIGDDRVAIANELPRWCAIRQIVVADFFLLEGYDYSTPGGQTIRITAKGFEVV